ncbi:MAG: glycosyltransferase [Paracoccaceae bacterium]|nr:glycosyltransferase [Paracoccaceae bacterium]
MTEHHDQTVSRQNVVSIICTTYNHSRYCRSALESIYAQDYAHIEVVVIDDGSTDGNSEVLKKVLDTSPFPHKLILQENTGNVPLNVNRAIEAASGTYLSFLSLDDLMLPGALSRKMAIIEKTPNCVLVADTVWREIDGAGKITAEAEAGPAFGKSDVSPDDLLEIEYENIGSFFIQGSIMRTDVVRAIGCLDTDISGDDIILRTKMFRHLAEHRDLTFRLMDVVGMAYRKHDNNLHLNTYNQVKTVVDWHGRYFPDRPLPALGLLWAVHSFSIYHAAGNREMISKLVDLHPMIRSQIEKFTRSWKFRRRTAKRWVRERFSLLKGKPV